MITYILLNGYNDSSVAAIYRWLLLRVIPKRASEAASIGHIFYKLLCCCCVCAEPATPKFCGIIN